MSGPLLRGIFVALMALALGSFQMNARAAGSGASTAGHASSPSAKRKVHVASRPKAKARRHRVASRHRASSHRRVASRHHVQGKRASASRSRHSRKLARGSRGAGHSGRTAKAVAIVPARPSIGRAIGLRRVDDPLDLGSSVALLVDASSGERLYAKNAEAVLPIASITKLMTAMVVIDSGAPMDEMLTVSREDVDTERHSRSRLTVGAHLSREELLQLALMSSENRAAHALARNYAGGMDAFVRAMNRKAHEIGMDDSNFVEPTGLSASNVSNAGDLVRLVRAAARYPTLRRFTTAPDLTVDTGYRQVRFGNTNRLVRAGWDIGIQKTGYISEAGRCLVMQTRVGGRPVVMVLLDSDGKYTRFGDARRLRHWLEKGGAPGFGAPSASVASHRSLES